MNSITVGFKAFTAFIGAALGFFLANYIFTWLWKFWFIESSRLNDEPMLTIKKITGSIIVIGAMIAPIISNYQ
jgi:hypothetical protein